MVSLNISSGQPFAGMIETVVDATIFARMTLTGTVEQHYHKESAGLDVQSFMR